MQVKWHNLLSTIRSLPGGGPHGCLLGQSMYTSQSNDSGKCASDEDMFKFVELVNLRLIVSSQMHKES